MQRMSVMVRTIPTSKTASKKTQLIGEFFTTCNGQAPHLRKVDCGLALFCWQKIPSISCAFLAVSIQHSAVSFLHAAVVSRHTLWCSPYRWTKNARCIAAGIIF